ncbi:hypothetical protein [[Phormidium] sp. ETS-05]|uniref:hypothetical protein n=1 Tax=[Phormidium] sp. ETS-05 TaxID=222819 RepID=UPI0018EF1E21|nr:hypothetical protein [[Phormidium] sp. ETS-05]
MWWRGGVIRLGFFYSGWLGGWCLQTSVSIIEFSGAAPGEGGSGSVLFTGDFLVLVPPLVALALAVISSVGVSLHRWLERLEVM